MAEILKLLNLLEKESFYLQVEFFAKIFYLETMRIVDDIEQQIQKSEFLAILIQAMKSIGESRMTDHYRTVINGLLQKNLPIDTFEQDFKVAPHMGKENYLEHRKGD